MPATVGERLRDYPSINLILRNGFRLHSRGSTKGLTLIETLVQC